MFLDFFGRITYTDNVVLEMSSESVDRNTFNVFLGRKEAVGQCSAAFLLPFSSSASHYTHQKSYNPYLHPNTRKNPE